MHPKKTNIVKTIIIAESLSETLTIPEGSACKYEVTGDIKNTIDSILQESEKNIIQTLIIIPYEKYQTVCKYLNLIDQARIFYQILIVGDKTQLQYNNLNDLHNIIDFITKDEDTSKIYFIIERAFSIIDINFKKEQEQIEYYNKFIDSQQDQEDLINVGKALSAEKKQDNLLRLILYLSKKITGADAGSIYLVEEDENSNKKLCFKYSHTFSRDIPLEEFIIDINKNSIAGYVAVTGEVLNIPDAHRLDKSAPYSFNQSFDKENNYISRSMLVVPMKNHTDDIIGVIQLLNSKEDLSGIRKYQNEAFEIILEKEEDFAKYVHPFDEKYNSLLEAIAGQAAVAIENNRLIKQIQNQFEEFVKASVSAIDSLDPATSGHSFRVSTICKKLALAVNNEKKGYLGDFYFNENKIKELELAGLLHDFGKVYIDPNIFKKAKKLYPKDLENLKLRLDYLYKFTELAYSSAEKAIRSNELNKKIDSSNSIIELYKKKDEQLNKLKEIKEELIKLNEPTIIEDEPEEVLTKILNYLSKIPCEDVAGNPVEILTDIDKINLKVSKGSLNPQERKEIESHVIETYNFVSKIPWPPEYKNIPNITLRHHEMINGSGYPDGLKGRESTTLQSRIMTIADIYDALTSQDRPYKKSISPEKVLTILQEEAQRNKLDIDLVNLFIEKKIYLDISSDKAEEQKELPNIQKHYVPGE